VPFILGFDTTTGALGRIVVKEYHMRVEKVTVIITPRRTFLHQTVTSGINKVLTMSGKLTPCKRAKNLGE